MRNLVVRERFQRRIEVIYLQPRAATTDIGFPLRRAITDRDRSNANIVLNPRRSFVAEDMRGL